MKYFVAQVTRNCHDAALAGVYDGPRSNRIMVARSTFYPPRIGDLYTSPAAPPQRGLSAFALT